MNGAPIEDRALRAPSFAGSEDREMTKLIAAAAGLLVLSASVAAGLFYGAFVAILNSDSQEGLG
jgi:hypothetical protein